METLFELTDGLHTVLDQKGLLSFDPSKGNYCLHVKVGNVDEKVPVFSDRYRFHFMENEIRDLLNTYYQFYFELMEETFSQYEKMNFHDIALGVATGMRLFYLYSPAFFEVRRIMNEHILKNQRPKPFNWDPNRLKFQENYQFVYEVCKNQFGLMIYQFDGYNFPEEVMHILVNEFKCVKKFPSKIVMEDWVTDAWEYKEGA